MPRRLDPETVANDRARLLAVASRLLMEHGLEAVTNRRVAKEAGLTTMALYSRLGGKSGLLDSLVSEGFAQLAGAQAEVPDSGDAVAEVVALCHAYRRVALAYPEHYRLMFGRVADWEPGAEVLAEGLRALTRLGDAVARAVGEGQLAGPPEALTWSLFATCHGHVSLELSTVGILASLDAAQVYEEAVRRLLT
ncbi:MAG: TetR/AcrR family transcriptional regulator [Myxococcales bacterium]|nr:TetR/AcrR family transcriptional regulator [Myxococcales bacterium]